MEDAADSFFVIEQGGSIIDINQMACQQFQYTRGELLTLSAPDIYTTVDESSFAETFDRLGSGEPATMEGIGRRKSGDTFPIELR